jgi:hypothetical protein
MNLWLKMLLLLASHCEAPDDLGSAFSPSLGP